MVHSQPQPEGVRSAPQPRAALVQLHMGQPEVPKAAFVQRSAVLSGTPQPPGEQPPKHATGSFSTGRHMIGHQLLLKKYQLVGPRNIGSPSLCAESISGTA